MRLPPSPRDFCALTIFLGVLGIDADKPHVDEILIPDLLRFSHILGTDMQCVVLCMEPCEVIGARLRAQDDMSVIVLPDNRLVTKLGIRVTPFAVLVDGQTEVLAKGLANHFKHFCRVVMKGGQARSKGDELQRLVRICQPLFPDHMHMD